MNDPLTKSQRDLRGRNIRDLSVEQLQDWIDACTKMERWVDFNKARRSWKRGREDATAELARRGAMASEVRPAET
jgi:hypothetical protein